MRSFKVFLRRMLPTAAMVVLLSTSMNVAGQPCPTVSITGATTLCKDCNSSLRTTQLSPTTGGTWKSNNPSVATVDNTGLVTARGAGSVTFTFTDSATGCEVETAPVTVKSPPPPDVKHIAESASNPRVTALQVTATGSTIRSKRARTNAPTVQGKNLTIAVQRVSTARIITLTGLVTGRSLPNPALTTWDTLSGNTAWGEAPTKDDVTYTVTIPANAIGGIVLTASAKDDPSKTITITINVTEFTLFYSHGNIRYGAETDDDEDETLSSEIAFTINLTSPIGAETRRLFTARNFAGTAGFTPAVSTWVLADVTGTGVANGDITFLYNGSVAGICQDVVIQPGYVGTFTLTIANVYVVTFNVTAGRPLNSAVAIGETFEASGIVWRMLAKGKGVYGEGTGNESDALIISENVLFAQRINSPATQPVTFTWQHCELRIAMNGEGFFATNAGIWYAGLDAAFLSMIVPTDIKTAARDGSGTFLGNYHTLTCQTFFLLSTEEVTGTPINANTDISNNLYPDRTLFSTMNRSFNFRVASILTQANHNWWHRYTNGLTSGITNSNHTADNGSSNSSSLATSNGFRPACVVRVP